MGSMFDPPPTPKGDNGVDWLLWHLNQLYLEMIPAHHRNTIGFPVSLTAKQWEEVEAALGDIKNAKANTTKGQANTGYKRRRAL